MRETSGGSDYITVPPVGATTGGYIYNPTNDPGGLTSGGCIFRRLDHVTCQAVGSTFGCATSPPSRDNPGAQSGAGEGARDAPLWASTRHGMQGRAGAHGEGATLGCACGRLWGWANGRLTTFPSGGNAPIGHAHLNHIEHIRRLGHQCKYDTSLWQVWVVHSRNDCNDYKPSHMRECAHFATGQLLARLYGATNQSDACSPYVATLQAKHTSGGAPCVTGGTAG